MKDFFITFCVLVPNLLFIFVFLREKKFFFKSSMTKIGIFILCFYVFIVLFFNFSLSFFIIFAFLPSIFVFLAYFFLFLIKKQTFERNFLKFLSFLILKMKTGSSFRDSVDKNCKDFDVNFNFTIQKIMQNVSFSQQKPLKIKDNYIKNIVNEFVFVDQCEHLAIQRLENFHYSLKKQSEFRHRSGQVSKQVQIQLIIISLLYVLVITSSLYWFSWKKVESLLLPSLFLFIFGVFTVLRIKRSFKWST